MVKKECMSKKYEFTDETTEVDGHTLHRIRAVRYWFESLKERYTWKPSEEQMNTLEYYMHTLICKEHKEVLFGLYADLKKLM